jgi:hypothetical protein
LEGENSSETFSAAIELFMYDRSLVDDAARGGVEEQAADSKAGIDREKHDATGQWALHYHSLYLWLKFQMDIDI